MLHRDADLPLEGSHRCQTYRLHADEEEKLPFPDGTFDLVMSSQSLHWVNDLPGLFKEAKVCMSEKKKRKEKKYTERISPLFQSLTSFKIFVVPPPSDNTESIKARWMFHVFHDWWDDLTRTPNINGFS